MRIGYIAYNDTTECEFISVNEIIGKVYQLDFPNPPDNTVIGVTPKVVGWNGIVIEPHCVYSDVSPDEFDLLVVPGGQSSRTVRYDTDFISWLRGWGHEKPIASCCSGALILAEAGFLSGKRATCHTLAFPTLAEYGDVDVVAERVVVDGNVTTSGGIYAAIDLGLHLVETYWGKEARRAIAHQDEYRDIESRKRDGHETLPPDDWYEGGHLPVHKRPADGVSRLTSESAQ